MHRNTRPASLPYVVQVRVDGATGTPDLRIDVPAWVVIRANLTDSCNSGDARGTEVKISPAQNPSISPGLRPAASRATLLPPIPPGNFRVRVLPPNGCWATAHFHGRNVSAYDWRIESDTDRTLLLHIERGEALVSSRVFGFDDKPVSEGVVIAFPDELKYLHPGMIRVTPVMLTGD